MFRIQDNNLKHSLEPNLFLESGIRWPPVFAQMLLLVKENMSVVVVVVVLVVLLVVVVGRHAMVT